MTTAARALAWAAALAAVAGWGAFLVAAGTGHATVPHSALLVLGLPPALVLALLLVRRPVPRQVQWTAGGMMLLSYGLFLTGYLVPQDPLVILALPAGLGAGVVCSRRPWIAIVALFALASTFGAINAFTPLPPSKLTELLLAGLWLGIGWRWLVSGERLAVRLLPGVVLLIAFAVITLAQVASAPTLDFGIHTFISTGLYLLTVVLVGFTEPDEARLLAIAKGVVAISVAVAAYAVLRDIIGPAAQERAIASRQPFNFKDGKLLLFGSFESRHQLGAWCALVVPFCGAMAAVLRGGWRLAALAVIPLSAVAFIDSESRSALVAAIVGLAVVLTLYSMAHAFPGPRLGAVMLAVVVLAGGGGAAIVLSGGDANETTRKFTVVLHPKDDAAYQARTRKWDETLREIEKDPMGHGLGTANQLQQQNGRFVTIGSFSIDNSYLRVGYEQGILPAVLFVAGLLALALGIVRRAVAVAEPARAGPALAAAGTLTAYIVLLYPSNVFDGYAALTAWLLAGIGLAPFLAEQRAARPAAASAVRARSAPALG